MVNRGRREAWFVLAVIGLVLAAGLLPTVVGYLAQPDGMRFAGFLLNPIDGESYLSKLQQGAEGSWLFHLTYSPDPQPGLPVYLFYLVLGHLAALLHAPLVGMFHLARLITGAAMLWLAYRLIAVVIENPRERRLAFVVVATSAGLGWLAVAAGRLPMDLSVPEAITFTSLLPNPHFALTVGAMIVIFLGVLQPVAGRYQGFVLFLAGAVLGQVQPFAWLPVGLTLVIWAAVPRRAEPILPRWWRRAALAFAGAAPFLLYDAWAMVGDPAFRGWSAQNVTPSPPLLDLALGYGLLLPLAAIGGWKGWQEGKSGMRLLVCWAVCGLVLIYAPFSLQRRLAIGLHLPLAILAAHGLWLLITAWLRPRVRQVALALTVLALAPSNVLVLASMAGAAIRPMPETHVSQDEASALQWLAGQPTEAVVLASPELSLFVPAWAGQRVVYGHPFETLDAVTRKRDAEIMLRGEGVSSGPDLAGESGQVRMDDRPASELYRRYQVRYVILGPRERALGAVDPPDGRVVFRQGEVQIVDMSTGAAAN